jgi:hypothetical protein
MSSELHPINDTKIPSLLQKNLGESTILLVIRSLDNPSSPETKAIIAPEKKRIVLSNGAEVLSNSPDEMYIDISEPNSPSEELELRRAHGFFFVVAKVLSEETGYFPIVRANPGTDSEKDSIARSYGSSLHQIQDQNEIVTVNKIIKVSAVE